MFTWICPKCGREVPPAYNECPDCAGLAAAPTSVPEADVPAAAEPAAPSPRAPSRGVTLPPWLMTPLFALAFLGLGAGAFFAVRYFGSRSQASGPPLALDNPRNGQTTSSPLQKYVEVVGVRLLGSGRKPEARFVVVNHSETGIEDLAANVNLWARTSKSDEEAVGVFSFKLPLLGPGESKELTAPLTTKLRIYELPDWQNLNAEIQITSPLR